MAECGVGLNHSSQTEKSPVVLEVHMVKQHLRNRSTARECTFPVTV